MTKERDPDSKEYVTYYNSTYEPDAKSLTIRLDMTLSDHSYKQT